MGIFFKAMSITKSLKKGVHFSVIQRFLIAGLLRALQPHQKLSMILVKKVVLKLKLSKNCFYKKCYPKLLFLLKAESEN